MSSRAAGRSCRRLILALFFVVVTATQLSVILNSDRLYWACSDGNNNDNGENTNSDNNSGLDGFSTTSVRRRQGKQQEMQQEEAQRPEVKRGLTLDLEGPTLQGGKGGGAIPFGGSDREFFWYQPKPEKPPFVGWEDDFMWEFKRKHYKGSQQKLADCELSQDHPYDHHYVCEVNAYIPARAPMDPTSQTIPRIIFVSWITRKITVQQYTSIMAVLAHNPEYELVFMVDHEVDQFVCADYPDEAPEFSKLMSGAARTDLWRMMIMYRYGGVYFDFDNTSIGHLPIPANASLVSGRRCYSHLPTKVRGLLEHWSFAIRPRHRLMERAIQIILDNIKDPARIDTKEHTDATVSYTVRLTGPMPFQQALHDLLVEADCRKNDMGHYCNPGALNDPEKFCNYDKFMQVFGGEVHLLGGDMERTSLVKILHEDKNGLPQTYHYDHEDYKPLQKPRGDFCTEVSFNNTQAIESQKWELGIKKKRGK